MSVSCYTCGHRASLVCGDCGVYQLCGSEACSKETSKIHRVICHDMTLADPKYVSRQLEETILDMHLCDVDKRYDQKDIDDAMNVLVELDHHEWMDEDEQHEVMHDANQIIADHLYDFAGQEAFASFSKEDQNAIIGKDLDGDYQLYHLSNMAFDRIDAEENEEARRERKAMRARMREERARLRANKAREYARRAKERAEKRAIARRRRATRRRERAERRRKALRDRAERRRRRANKDEARGEKVYSRGMRSADRSDRSAKRAEKWGDFKDRNLRKYADYSDKRGNYYAEKDKSYRETAPAASPLADEFSFSSEE